MPIQGLSKDWYKSKLIWLGIVTTALSALEIIRLFLEKGDFSPEAIVGVVVGVTIVILRKVTVSSIR